MTARLTARGQWIDVSFECHRVQEGAALAGISLRFIPASELDRSVERMRRHD